MNHKRTEVRSGHADKNLKYIFEFESKNRPNYYVILSCLEYKIFEMIAKFYSRSELDKYLIQSPKLI